MSWLVAFGVVNVRNQLIRTLVDFLYRVTEPVLRPIRRVLPNLGGIDISPVVALLLIFFLLFSTFGSVRQAALVLSNVPLALIGGIAALAVTGEYLSVPASVGFIALLGIAVLNGVVMLSVFQQLRNAGYTVVEADSGEAKFLAERPRVWASQTEPVAANQQAAIPVNVEALLRIPAFGAGKVVKVFL